MLVLFCFLACMCISQCKITIKDVGMAAPTRGDVGMIFYITISNTDIEKYLINVKMVKCCESFTNGDMDCQLMNLMGGDMGWLHPNVTKNISLLYPNMYLHNRKGQCLVSIKGTGKHTFEKQQKIIFNTCVNCTENRILRDYYVPKDLTKCKSIDEDPLDNCEPINCNMKYLGYRNFFNRKWSRCQKVPVCIADPEKDLPDVLYLPVSNMCRDLEDLISVEDLKYLEKGITKGYWEQQNIPEIMTNLRCHHGTINNETGFCDCDDGWTSAPLDKDQYEPNLSIYHMCNIEMSTWNNYNNTKIKMTMLLLIVLGGIITACIVMLSFACHFCYTCIKPRTPVLPPSEVETSENEKFIESDTLGGESSDGDDSPASLSKESLNESSSIGSLQNASIRDSRVFHRKSLVDHRKLPSASTLRVIERITRGDSLTPAEMQEGEATLIEKTESFHPSRDE